MESNSSLLESVNNTKNENNAEENDDSDYPPVSIQYCIVCLEYKKCKFQVTRNKSSNADSDVNLTSSQSQCVTYYVCDDECFSKFHEGPTLYLKAAKDQPNQPSCPDVSISQSNSKIDSNDFGFDEPSKTVSNRSEERFCLFCHAAINESFKNLFISGDITKKICTKHLPCQAIQVSAPTCVECDSTLSEGRMKIDDSSLDFCSEKCLNRFLPKLSVNCFSCNKVLTKEAFGQYCLSAYMITSIIQIACTIDLYENSFKKKITSFIFEHRIKQCLKGFEDKNIRQFCSEVCLQKFDPEAKYCLQCHLDITDASKCFKKSNNVVEEDLIFCNSVCIDLYDKITSQLESERQSRQYLQSRCSICKTVKPIPQKIVHNEEILSICSSKCMQVFQAQKANANYNRCEYCRAGIFGRKNLTLVNVQGKASFFCSPICVDKFKNETTNNNKITPCEWCSANHFLKDMIVYKVDESGEKEDLYLCSNNCLSLYELSKKETSRSQPCAACARLLPAQYKITLSDTTSKLLCSFHCVTTFKNSYEKQNSVVPSQPQIISIIPLCASNVTERSHSNSSAFNANAADAYFSQEFMRPPKKKIGRPPKRKSDDPPYDAYPQRFPLKSSFSNTNLSDQNNGVSITSLNALIFKLKDYLAKNDCLINLNKSCSVKNKCVSASPIQHSKGVSTSKDHFGSFRNKKMVDVAVQTGYEFQKLLPIPIPIPLFVPFPMQLYSSFIPIPLPIPVPMVVPSIIPAPYEKAEDILSYIKNIRDKLPSDPLQAEILMMAEMAENTNEEQAESSALSAPITCEIEEDRREVATSDALGADDVLQLALRMASEYEGIEEGSAEESSRLKHATQSMSAKQSSMGFDLSPRENATTAAIPFQNADGTITYATIDPSTGTLTPIDPELLQQQHGLTTSISSEAASALTSISPLNEINSSNSASIRIMTSLNAPMESSIDNSRKRVDSSIPEVKRIKSETISHLFPLEGSSKKRLESRAIEISKRIKEEEITDFSPPFTFTLDTIQKHLESVYGLHAYKNWAITKNSTFNNYVDGFNKRRKSSKYFKEDPLLLTTDELLHSLSLFVKETKKENGEEYTSDTIYYFCLGIQQYLSDNGRVENVFTDTSFGQFTDALNEVLLRFEPQITTEGILLSRVDEEALWESNQLGAHSPHVLLNSLLYFNTKYFHLTTLEAHLSLSFAHIIKRWKTANISNHVHARNVYLRYYPQGAPTDGNTDQADEGSFDQEENVESPLRCPVRLYEFYISKCPENVRKRTDLFYLLPEASCLPDSPLWYSSQSLPATILAKMFNRIFIVRETLESNITL